MQQTKHKFKANEFVRIKQYEESGINGYGRVSYIKEDGRVFVTNMNMPFLGTVNNLFDEDELERSTRNA